MNIQISTQCFSATYDGRKLRMIIGGGATDASQTADVWLRSTR